MARPKLKEGGDLKKNKHITGLINTAGKINRVQIYDVEFKFPLLRVYIDREDQGVDLDVCEKFMKSLLFLLQSENKTAGLECEVSTPGLERKLKKDRHFLKAIGETVKVYTRRPVASYDTKTEKRNPVTVFSGQLDKYRNNIIHVKNGAVRWEAPLSIITKAHIVFKEKKQNKRGEVV